MLRISPSMGHTLDVSLALRHLLFLLEYCMVTGYDWWDTLLHVQPGMVQSLVEKLHEEYTRQNAALQQVAHSRGAKAALPPRQLSVSSLFCGRLGPVGRVGPTCPAQSPPSCSGELLPGPRGVPLPVPTTRRPPRSCPPGSWP